MDTYRKLEILSEDSQYDLACACGTDKNDRRKRTSDGKWLYPVTLPNGGKSVLLKTLLSNSCQNDCKYCPLRHEGAAKRCTLGIEETADAVMDYWRKRKVFGMFLSSGVIKSPDFTMDRLNGVAHVLRKKHGFTGYIHLKIIPGASDAAIEDSLSIANAVSLNIETPGREHFKLLSESKNYDEDIIRPLKLMSSLTGKGGRYSRRKCTTQFIVGASDEGDNEIVKYMFGIYERLKFERVYFSAYQAGLGNSEIPGEQRFGLEPGDILTREHRLYQADFLIRKYGFTKDDFFFDEEGLFDLGKDPKEIWAERNPHVFPVNLNTANKELLLKVPGLGVVSVNRILKARKSNLIDPWNLLQLNIKGKRYEKVIRYSIFK